MGSARGRKQCLRGGCIVPILRPWGWKRRGRLLLAVCTAAALGGFAGWESWPISHSGDLVRQPMVSLERALYDTWFALRGPKPYDSRLAVVGFDTQTEKALGQPWPPSRKLYAQALRNMLDDGAKVIVFDILLETPSDPESDAALARVLNTTDKVVLPCRMDRDPNPRARRKSLIVPLSSESADFTKSAALGLVEIPVDDDGVVRRFLPGGTLFGEPVPSLALMAWMRLNRIPEESLQLGSTLEAGELRLPLTGTSATDPVDGSQMRSIDAAFASGQEGLPTLCDLAEAASGKVPKGTFTGKVVFVGITGSELVKEMNDQYLTSAVSRRPELVGAALRRHVPGVAIQAGYLNCLLQGEWVRPTPAWVRALFGSLLAGLMTLVAFRWGDWRGMAATAGLTAASLAASFLAFGLSRIALPVGSALAVSLLAAVSVAWSERTRLRRRWSRYLSPRVFQMVAAEDSDELSRRCHATVLFLDIRGFTQYAAAHPPQEVMDALNRHFEQLLPAVMAEDGTVDKYVGDGLLAVFGAPVPLADQAKRAVRAALQIQKLDTGFDIGIGIATGDVVAGHVGAKARMDFSIVGDAANFASRLQGLSVGQEVRIDEATASEVHDAFVLEPCEPALVKGYELPVQTFRVVGVRET